MTKQREATVALSHSCVGESGPALLVLHGLFGAGSNWRSIARGLSDCRRVYLLDARNHGASPHSPQVSYRAMAADVDAFMQYHQIAMADIIGHSMGGKAAMQLALHYPSRVSRLLVVDIAPSRSPSDHLPLIDALLALPLNDFTSRSQVDQALAQDVADAGLRAFLLQNLVHTANGFAWRINLPVLRERMPELLDFDTDQAMPFSGPTTFIRGAQSNYLLDEHSARINELFPGAQRHTVANAGHWLHAEQPKLFLQAARKYLQCDASEGE